LTDSEGDKAFFAQFRKIDDLVRAWSRKPVLSQEESPFAPEEMGFSIRVNENEFQSVSFPGSLVEQAGSWDPLTVIEQSETAFIIQLDVAGVLPGQVSIRTDAEKALLVQVQGMPFKEKRIPFNHPVRPHSLKWEIRDEKLMVCIQKRPLDSNEKFIPL
jgi:HSP20 family molecular chaperone IbpA